jgi:hypothetical protein
MPATVEQAHGRVGAVIVTAPHNVDATAALLELLEGTYPEDDTVAVYPDGVNWKVSELLDHVISPARYAADHHRNILVADSHQAQAAAHDKLLKSLEEPFTNTTFWLCHPDTATLPATLRGRAIETLHIPAPSRVEARDRLAAEGVSSGAAADALIDLADGDLNLAVVVARFGMEDVLGQLAQGPWTRTPHLTAGQVLLAAAHLAIALGHKTKRPPVAPRGKGSLATADLTKLKPEQRARLRRLLGRTLDRWERELLASTRTVESVADMRVLEGALDGIAAARDGGRFNTPAATILARALTAMPPPPDDPRA